MQADREVLVFRKIVRNVYCIYSGTGGGHIQMKKINIMFLYSAKGFGGMVRNLSLLVNNLDKERFDVTVVSLANQGDADSDVNIDVGGGITFVRIDEKKRLDIDSLRRIDGLIRDKNIDILSCHGYKADVYGVVLRLKRLLRRDSRKTHPPRNDSAGVLRDMQRDSPLRGQSLGRNLPRMVAMVHGWTMSGMKVELYHILDKLVLRAFDKVILVADGLRTGLKGWMVPERKIEVVYNAIPPINVGEFESRDDIRQSLGMGKDDIVVGFVGRLSREKDLGTTLLAIKELVTRGNNIKLIVVGDGPEKERLVDIINRNGLNKNMVFAGFQKEAGRYFRAFDIYLSTSVKEGLPNSVLEAQARGVPCVVTDIRGNNDIVKDSVNGILVKSGNYKDIAEKLSLLISDGALRQKFSGTGKEMIKNNFSMANRMEKLERIYIDLVG
jgi:glycosyltransferase involved in cell wall biosynthesis